MLATWDPNWTMEEIMDGQGRLYVSPPEALHFSAHWVYPDGWKLTVSMRRVEQSWQGAYHAQYDHLSTDEMFQVAEDELKGLWVMADSVSLEDELP